MRDWLAAAVLAASLVACAAPQGGGEVDGGAAVLTAIGTPFLIVAKIPVCLLTIVAAGPIGATATLVPPEDPLGHDVRQGLADGIDNNCGPPYAVTP
jgi:hypothetical protein